MNGSKITRETENARPVVVAQRLRQPGHLAYNWIGKNAYFADGKQEIEACDMSFTLCAHLPTLSLKKIRSEDLQKFFVMILRSGVARGGAEGRSAPGATILVHEGGAIFELTTKKTAFFFGKFRRKRNQVGQGGTHFREFGFPPRAP